VTKLLKAADRRTKELLVIKELNDFLQKEETNEISSIAGLSSAYVLVGFFLR